MISPRADPSGLHRLSLQFVLVFPGFTGILAGSNLTSNLRSPTRSIAFGTLSSLCFVLGVYAVICCSLAATVDREVLKTNLMIMNTVVEANLKVGGGGGGGGWGGRA